MREDNVMPNFPGVKPYPLLANRTPMVDQGPLIRGLREPSIPRGGLTADYNVKLRGTGRRIDRLPERPYP